MIGLAKSPDYVRNPYIYQYEVISRGEYRQREGKLMLSKSSNLFSFRRRR